MNESPNDETSQPEVGGSTGVVDLRDLIWFWLKWFWVLIPLAAIGAYQGYQDLQTFQPKYEAFLVVAPEEGGGLNGGSAGPLLQGFGLSIDGGAKSQTFERLKIIFGSTVLASRLQEKYGLMQEVFAGSWDAAKQDWIRPAGEKFERQERVRRLLRQNSWSPPSLEKFADFIRGSIKVKTDNTSKFSTLTIQSDDRDFALRFLTVVYSEADELLREQDREQVESKIVYAEDQLSRTSNVDSRQTLFGILASAQQKKMLLRSGLPYAARIIDGPVGSQRRTEPNVRFTFAVSILLWMASAFVLITLVFLFREESKRRR